ncbi:LppU/SCO3897 family protein [Petropleomorpha daqingensis]|uniref:Uncharacterized protein n=1 Tax=Petropleomorpha daqingensis TaxID=2026353 RepID=A0A853C710_9ACTN|nr:hypothetical protein [Petropleomorpha daqingensis]NYJ03820.1 hypothetical protein [Petropleomorpha daqingensis]
MTTTGPDVQPPAQPGQPYQQWGPDQQQQLATPPAPAPAKSNVKKWGSIAGAVVVAGGLAAFRLTGGFGAGDPSVGDCIEPDGSSFDMVACDDEAAAYKIVGVEEKKQNYGDFQNDPDVCASFPTAVYAAWYGDQLTEDGTVYCAEEI